MRSVFSAKRQSAREGPSHGMGLHLPLRNQRNLWSDMEAAMFILKKVTLIFLLLAGLAACGTNSTTLQPPTPVPANTKTAIPATPTATPTITPIPPLNSPSGPPLKSIHMFTPADGWGLISDSLLITHNGGINWFSVPMSDGQLDDQSDAFFFDVNTAYLLVPSADRQTGQLYFTSNGGGTWQISNVPFLRGQLIFRGGIGYFLQLTATASDLMKVVIFASQDNGLTWTAIYPGQQQSADTTIPDSAIKTGAAFISPERGWLGAASQRGKITLYRTTNAAIDWGFQQLPAPQNIASLTTTTLPPIFFPDNSSDGLLPVDFISTDTGDRNRVFYATADAGENWSPGGSVIDAEAYTFLDPKTGWVWGKHGLYFTNDGAQSWQLLPVAFGKSEHATYINFIDINTGWLLTADAKNRVRIYATHDGGNTWMAVNP